MEPEKLPLLNKNEYDNLINEQYLCRISYVGEKFPQIKLFLYVFDGRHIYILATKYGKKMKYLKDNPIVTVEIDDISEDLADYKFVTLSGRLERVMDKESCKKVREKFVDLIKEKTLSKNVMVALGHSNEDPIDAISEEERTYVFRLVDVEDISGFKRGE